MGFIGQRFDFINGCKIAARPESTGVFSPQPLNASPSFTTMERHLDFLLM